MRCSPSPLHASYNTGVANRVAEERGEDVGGMGSAIGYMIRGENRTTPSTRLAFCTTGIILRRLQAIASAGGSYNGGLMLGGITHLIMDEVHERGLDSDFLLVLIKRLLKGSPHLRIILMSATMDTKRLAAYFCDALPQSAAPPPILGIPGFTHPVEDIYLEKICGPKGFLGYTPARLRKVLEDDSIGQGNPEGGDREKEATIDYRLLGHLIRHICGPEFARSDPGPAQVGEEPKEERESKAN